MRRTTTLRIILVLVCFSALVVGCSVVSPIPSCPTDDAYEYFSCAKPTFYGSGEESDVFRGLVDVVDAYCEDDAGEWVPVLEERVRSSLPEVKEFLASGQKLGEWLPEVFTLEGQAMESLNEMNSIALCWPCI